MSHHHAVKMFASTVKALCAIASTVALLVGTATAQSRTPTDGYTPTGLATGAPAGSYPLSGFDNINLFNGHLSIDPSLLQVSGRGAAGLRLKLPVDWAGRGWEIRSDIVDISGSNYEVKSAIVREIQTPLYRPIRLIGIRTADRSEGSINCGVVQPVKTLTRLKAITDDGTELFLIDEKYQGATQLENLCNSGNPTGANRGKVFRSRDGGSMTFISDTDIFDDRHSGFHWEISVSGVLLMSDGTRYRIDGGSVSWIRDRNGNKVSFSGNTITDSLGRQVTINVTTTAGSCDVITYNGFGETTRTVKVCYSQMSQALRPDFTIKTGAELFPEIYNFNPPPYNDAGWTHNPTVVSYVELPDGRRYEFFYNSYGEVARVILPTGGGYDYDYIPSGNNIPGTSTPGNVVGLMVYRRLNKKTVYNTLMAITDPANPPAGAVERRGVMSVADGTSTSPGIPATVVTMEHKDSGNALQAQEKHYFYGSPTEEGYGCVPVVYSPWYSGREYRTESYNVIGGVAGAALRQTDTTWAPSLPSSHILCSPTGNVSPPPDPRISETRFTLVDAGLVAKQTFSYDQYNNQTDVWEYDYGTGAPGALQRHVKTAYLTSGYDTIVGGITNPNPAATIHIRNLPISQAIYSDAGTSNKMAETTYECDDYTTADGFHAQLITRANISGLCDGTAQNCPNGPNFTDFNHTTRGNVTKVSRWLNTPSGTVNTYQQYDVAGNVVKALDGNGNAADFDFRDNFGSPDDPTVRTDDIPANSAPGELGAQMSYAFPFKVTNALGHKAYTKYDYYLGRAVLSEDPNNIKSGVYFNDALDRPTKGVRAIGTSAASQIVFVYNDSNSAVNGNPPRSITTISDKDVFGESNSGNGLKSLALYDGLGRTWRGATYEGNTGSSNTWLISDTQFDALGRMSKVSNPFRLNAPDGSPGSLEWTTTEYDALSRVKTVTTHDGAFVTTTYSGNTVTVEDQHDPDDPDPAKQVGRKRRSEIDALGRLTKVTEDPSTGGLNYDTTYFYDALGNLLKVAQGSQRRWFAYDSLSRLIRARNPEHETFNFTFNPPQSTVTVTAGGESNNNWSAAYVYDPNGNLLKKKSVTGPSGSPAEIETSYLYDTLNRNTLMTYSSYPNGSYYVERHYDGAVNGKGRFSYDIAWNYRWEKPTDNAAHHHNLVSSYDPLGRPLNHSQHFFVLEGGSWQWKPYSLSRTYDLAGNVKTQTYPSGRTVNYGYDTSGRPNSFTGNLGGGAAVNYATDIQYNAYGLMKRETYGTQTLLYHNLKYNNRLQMVDFRVGDSSTDEWNYSRGAIAMLYGRAAVDGWAMFANCKDNNGNAVRQLHYAPLAGGGDVITQRDDYTHDALNRLKLVTENQRNQSGQWTPSPVFTQAFLYDRWGNRTIDMAATTSGVPGVTRKNFVVDTTTNRMTSVDGCTMTYDATGNQTYDCVGTHYYDSENRMTKAVQGGSNHYYFYDANGKRVRRIINGSETWNGQETWFVYGFDGELVAEYTYNQVTAPLPGAPQKEYGYRGGKMLMVWDGSQSGDDTLKWLVSDQLGSTRWEINKSGSLGGTKRHDYLPFGEELVASTGAQRSGVGYEPPASNVKQKFGSHERDTETGLDYFGARYVASIQGRFSSVDPSRSSAMVVNPQSWNRYSYTNNLPTCAIDPDGLRTYYLGGFRNANPPVYKDKGFLPAVGKHFGEQVKIVPWSGKLKDKKNAAVALKNFIAADLAEKPLAPGEKVNVVTFSHGGNVVKHYTNLSGATPIDTFIALALPHQRKIQINRFMVDVYINAYQPNDRVQMIGGDAGRTDESASYNVVVTAEDEGGFDRFLHHAGIHTEEAFERIFRNIEYYDKFQRQLNQVRNGVSPWDLIIEWEKGIKENYLR